MSRFRSRLWLRFLRGPDSILVDELYTPALSMAVRYDRCASYFSSSALAVAASGFGGLIDHLLARGDSAVKPAVRLLVNEQLDRRDVAAMLERGDTSALEQRLLTGLSRPSDEITADRLAMLAWLYQTGLLDIRVGLMRHGGAIVHGKFGIAYDSDADAVVFAGSGNETASGLQGNYEQVEVSVSWCPDSDAAFDPMVHTTEDLARLRNYEHEFDLLWRSEHPDVFTVELPAAVRENLIEYAPSAPPTRANGRDQSLERRKLAVVWGWLAEAPYLAGGEATCDATMPILSEGDLWPHHRRVIDEVSSAWPEGRLLCDEVGMGKTIQAIAVLRRLLAGRGVQRALLLVPAGLLVQWQAELREKGGLLVPRLEGQNRLVDADGHERRVDDLPAALREPILLMSREAARMASSRALVLDADPWDLVLLDESHAARRAKSEEREFNSPNLLLGLIRDMRSVGTARSILLLSATPMQTQPWEPWDLLDVLGEGDPWFAEFAEIRDFYDTAAEIEAGGPDSRKVRTAAELIDTDPLFPSVTRVVTGLPAGVSTETALAFAKPGDRSALAGWMRRNAPLARRMHRNTRATLREYFRLGLLSAPPPKRVIDDIPYDFDDADEREVYDAIEGYIDKRYALLERDQPGKGFVMTIYKRRAASSPVALARSLGRRKRQLQRVARSEAPDLFSDEEEAASADLDELEEDLGRLPAGLPTTPAAARQEVEEIDELLGKLAALNNTDTKRDVFVDGLRRITGDGRAALVFTGYTDTLEYLRDFLLPLVGKELGCYSGAGGQLLVDKAWTTVSKTAITDALKDGRVRVLLCTDAASEGLNLQAAAALINYDLPWNPSKVEQRIGRIDRIGQREASVLVVNLFLLHSVDDDVYRVLRARCGLFVHFVGPMQPVLSRARRMLLGREPRDLRALEAQADAIEADHLSRDVYIEAEAAPVSDSPAGVDRSDLLETLARSSKLRSGPVQVQLGSDTATITGIADGEIVVSANSETLADDMAIRPLSLLDPAVPALADAYGTRETRLPLVIASAASEGHRASIAVWIGAGGPTPVNDFASLTELLDDWKGASVDGEKWVKALTAARREAATIVDSRAAMCAERREAGAARRVGAARRRLELEVGRYLVAESRSVDDLNSVMYRSMQGSGEGASRLLAAYARLGGYPEWSSTRLRQLAEFDSVLTPNRRSSRLSGKEVDAALADPRWRSDTQPGWSSGQTGTAVPGTPLITADVKPANAPKLGITVIQP